MAVGLIGGHVTVPAKATLLREAQELPDGLVERFFQIAGLEENWNGYGAPSIEPACIEDAIRIVKVGLAMGLPAPGVAPGGDAGIGIEWAAGQWELSIDIVPDGDTTYALDKLLPNGAVEEREGTLRMIPEVNDNG